MDPFTALLPKRKPLRVLLLGAGGREHALAVHLLRSPGVEHVYVAPGNGGTAGDRCTNVTNVAVEGKDFGKMVAWAQQHNIDLVVPGPEQPLVDGAQEAFRRGERALRTSVCPTR